MDIAPGIGTETINYYLYSGHSVLCLDPVSFWQYPGMDIYFVPFGTFLVIFLD